MQKAVVACLPRQKILKKVHPVGLRGPFGFHVNNKTVFLTPRSLPLHSTLQSNSRPRNEQNLRFVNVGKRRKGTTFFVSTVFCRRCILPSAPEVPPLFCLNMVGVAMFFKPNYWQPFHSLS